MSFCSQSEVFSDLRGDAIARERRRSEEAKEKEPEELTEATTKSVMAELK